MSINGGQKCAECNLYSSGIFYICFSCKKIVDKKCSQSWPLTSDIISFCSNCYSMDKILEYIKELQNKNETNLWKLANIKKWVNKEVK